MQYLRNTKFQDEVTFPSFMKPAEPFSALRSSRSQLRLENQSRNKQQFEEIKFEQIKKEESQFNRYNILYSSQTSRNFIRHLSPSIFPKHDKVNSYTIKFERSNEFNQKLNQATNLLSNLYIPKTIESPISIQEKNEKGIFDHLLDENDSPVIRELKQKILEGKLKSLRPKAQNFKLKTTNIDIFNPLQDLELEYEDQEEEAKKKKKKLQKFYGFRIDRAILSLKENLSRWEWANLQALLPFTTFWYKIDIGLPHPSPREGCTMTSHKKNIYLFGGNLSGRNDQLWVLNWQDRTWKEIEQNCWDFLWPHPRIGHSMCLWKNQLILYGGTGDIDKIWKSRTIFQKIHLYDINQGKWNQWETIGQKIQGRFWHCAVIVMDSMIVYGGIEKNNKASDCLEWLNLSTLTWVQPKVLRKKHPGAIHSFTMTAIFDQNIMKGKKAHDLFSINVKNSQGIYDEVNSGIYIFGGRNDHDEFNDLWILKANQDQTMEFTKPEIKGMQPIARYGHQAILIKQRLFIFGGRNDSTKVDCISNVSALNIEFFQWEIIESYGNLACGRYRFGMELQNDKVIILGGITMSHFCNPELYVCETNQILVSTCRKAWKKLQKKNQNTQNDWNQQVQMEQNHLGNKVHIKDMNINSNIQKSNVVQGITLTNFKKAQEEDDDIDFSKNYRVVNRQPQNAKVRKKSFLETNNG